MREKGGEHGWESQWGETGRAEREETPIRIHFVRREAISIRGGIIQKR